MRLARAALGLALALALSLSPARGGDDPDPSFVQGRIFDRETRDPLPAFILSDEGESCSADGRGMFRLAVRRPGAATIVLTVYLLGYKKRTVEARPGAVLSIGLELEPLAPREISVSAESAVSDAKGQKTISLDRMDIYRIPGAAADPVYASHILPGVNAPPDASSLLIRGGAPGEVLYVFDGIEIAHPFLSESLHESYFSIFDNQVVEAFSVSTSGLPPKYGDALSGVMDITVKDLLPKSEGGLGLSVLGLTSYIALPIGGAGCFVGSYDRGFSDVLTRLNSREGERDFNTEHAFGKLVLRLSPAQTLRVYGLYDSYRYAEGEGPDFRVGSDNRLAALAWTASWSKALVTRAVLSATRYDMSFDQPDALRVRERDDISQLRLEALWDLGRHLIEWNADLRARRTETNLLEPDPGRYAVRGLRAGFSFNDRFRLTDRLFLNAGLRVSALDLTDRGPAIDPRLSAAWLLTRKDILRLSAGIYHQYGDYHLIHREPGLKPMAAAHYSLSYDHLEDGLELRLTAYDKEYSNLPLAGPDGSASDGGFGYARGAELFLKSKGRGRQYILVYNFLRSRRKEDDLTFLAPSPYEIIHSATAVVSWTLGKTEVGFRYSIASGRPYTALLGREWDGAGGTYVPLWGEPYGARYPFYHRLDVTANTRFMLGKRLLVLYAGLTNVLNNTNILRYDYGDDYADRKDRQSVFGRSLFLGLYVPFF